MNRSPYARVASLIRYLESAESQPGLAELAAVAGLSEGHVQRLFADWAGVSPKRFLQALTKEHAKRVLRQRHSVLAASVEAGLSGPGRLHDLLVECDAVSPGEVGALGAGLEIAWGFATTPLGEALIATTGRGICRIDFVDGDAGEPCPMRRREAAAALAGEWPQAARVRDDDRAARLADRLFPFPAGSPSGPLHLVLKGTNFQIQVWQALLRLPPGSLTTYGGLAATIGRPDAARAVGAAVARNPVAVLIPCHRVIREGGALGGYRWGLDRKRALIARETATRAG